MVNCCVFGCSNNLKNAPVTLHNFPRKAKEPKRYKAWIDKINRANFTPNHYHVVCSIHFKEEDFEYRYMKQLLPNERIVRKLRKTAVPSLLLGKDLIAYKKKNVSKCISKMTVIKIENTLLQEDDESESALNNVKVEPIDIDENVLVESTSQNIDGQCKKEWEAFYKCCEDDANDKPIHLKSEGSDSDVDIQHIYKLEDKSSSSENEAGRHDYKMPFEVVLV